MMEKVYIHSRALARYMDSYANQPNNLHTMWGAGAESQLCLHVIKGPERIVLIEMT